MDLLGKKFAVPEMLALSGCTSPWLFVARARMLGCRQVLPRGFTDANMELLLLMIDILHGFKYQIYIYTKT